MKKTIDSMLVLLLMIGLPIGCSKSNEAEDCPTGSEGCKCTSGGACDNGLTCFSNLCVNPNTKVPDSGTMPNPKKEEFKKFLDGIPTKMCEWLSSCGKLSGSSLEKCITDLKVEIPLGTIAECSQALDFYSKNQAALDGCLKGQTGACGSDDVEAFCPTMKDFDFEGKCQSTPKIDSGVQPPSDCTETTFKITNWSGTPPSNALYTGTSWKLEKCTEIQPDNLTITIKCQKDSYGNTDFISEGCGVLGAAAPGNILNDVGSPPSGGKKACAGQTVSNTTITCYQECKKELAFTITSGPCK